MDHILDGGGGGGGGGGVGWCCGTYSRCRLPEQIEHLSII